MIDSLSQQEEEIPIILLRESLLKWWEVNGRHSIPWKKNCLGKTPASGELLDPYPIWIAEVMLQQTQFNVVLPFWNQWMNTFPSLDSLISSNEEEVLYVWQGLGYYSRGRRIYQAAIALKENQKVWPLTLEGWTELPGIGRTTAGSILSSAFDLPFPILDGNVKRLISRLIAFPKSPVKHVAKFWKLSEYLLDKKRPRDFNQALMDLGSFVCKPVKPSCNICPWKSYCIAYSNSKPILYPMKSVSKKKKISVVGIGIVTNDKGQILIDQRLNDGAFGGLWEFPGGKQKSGEKIEFTIAREIKEEIGIIVSVGEHLITLQHTYGQKKVHLIVHFCSIVKGEPKPLSSQQLRWVGVNDLKDYPFPAANERINSALIHKYAKR